MKYIYSSNTFTLYIYNIYFPKKPSCVILANVLNFFSGSQLSQLKIKTSEDEMKSQILTSAEINFKRTNRLMHWL